MPKLWEYGECLIPNECAGCKSTWTWNIIIKICNNFKQKLIILNLQTEVGLILKYPKKQNNGVLSINTKYGKIWYSSDMYLCIICKI